MPIAKERTVLPRFIGAVGARSARGRERLSREVYAALAALVLASWVDASVDAQPCRHADKSETSGLGSDIKAYVTAPLHAKGPQWVRFGATLAAVATAYQYDEQLRAHFYDTPPGQGEPADTHDSVDALPAALALGGTWLAAIAHHDPDGCREAVSMFEAAAFSSVSTWVLKAAAGRERPYVSGDAGQWHTGGDSFPSGHTAAAFAIGTVLAESGNDRYRWLRRVLGYGLGVGTAYARVSHDAHWLSDTVAGAGVGVGTARFVMKRRDQDDRRSSRLTLTPADGGGGIQLSYVVDLRR